MSTTPTPRPVAEVWGDGDLATFVRRRLAAPDSHQHAQTSATRGAPKAPLAVCSTWPFPAAGNTGTPSARHRHATAQNDTDTHPPADTGLHDEPGVYQTAEDSGRPWLPLLHVPGALVFGPASLPGLPGCPRCAWRRIRRNQPTPTLDTPPAPAPPVLLDLVTSMLTEELPLLRTEPASARTHGTLFRCDVRNGLVSRHSFLPEPDCPRCTVLMTTPGPPHTPPVVTPTPKPAPHALRARDGTELAATAHHRYVDEHVGLIHSVEQRPHGGRPLARALRDPARRVQPGHHGWGHGKSPRAAATSAVLEALERLGGLPPTPTQTAVTKDSYRQLGEQAVNPALLGLHPESSHQLHGFPYRRWTPDTKIPWAWGRDLTDNRPVLVPASAANYAYWPPEQPRFVQETSNGCALGSTWTEALLHGLLEVAERDAFLATWYTRLPLPRLDLSAATDPRIRVTTAWARQQANAELVAFDATLEQGIPAVWVTALADPEATHQPAVLCGAAARLHLEDALHSALAELTDTLLHPPPVNRDAAKRMLQDPYLVQDMDDHRTLYALPQAAARLNFLPFTGPAHAPAERARLHPWPTHHDLADDLHELVRRYARDGMRVIAVDQTRPEHQAAGLHCARVLITGTLPMTYGHACRRIDGLPRVRTLPRILGHRPTDLDEDDINPHPHPFP